MSSSKKNLTLAVAVAAAVAAPSVFATNGMNMQGYGPIAYGMGGASMAYDNGVAAVMNNPATLGLMPQGSRIDVAYGYLGPNVDAKFAAGVQEAPRLRHQAVAARAHRPHRGERRSHGPLPLGLPPDPARYGRGISLRRIDRNPEGPRHGPLHRIA